MSAKLGTTMKLLEHFVITTSDQTRQSQLTTILRSSSREERREEREELPNSCAAKLPSAGSPACLYCARPDNDSYYAASMTSNDNHSPRYQWCQWQSQNLRGIITNTINSLVLASSIIRTNIQQYYKHPHTIHYPCHSLCLYRKDHLFKILNFKEYFGLILLKNSIPAIVCTRFWSDQFP